MGDWIGTILSAVTQLCLCSAERAAYIEALEDNLRSLRTSMHEVKDMRDDFERRSEAPDANLMEKKSQLDGWLKRTKDMEPELNELLDEGSKDIEERCLGCCPRNCYSSYKLGKKVAQRKEEVLRQKSEGEKFNVVIPLPPRSMDLNLEMAWSFINQEQVGTMGIYGPSGGGKTTLLKRINDEFLQRGILDFDVVIWVNVVISKIVREWRIQEDIAQRLGLSLPVDGSLIDRASMLSSELCKKRFALLLDAISEWVDFTAIGIPRPDINNKSKVLFTTDSEDVCKRMGAQKNIKVECLNFEEAWNLFKEKVGEEVLNSHPDILRIARDVAKLCAGLPLALVIIAQAMSNKKTPQEWESAITILKKFTLESSGMENNIYPFLKFGYDCLPDDTIRSCFLYCSLFPEDHSIEIEQLTHYWIGEGFLGTFDDMNEAQNKVYDIVGTLKQACLLESDQDLPKEKIKMHDVLRGMALWITCDCGRKKDKFLVRTGVHSSEELEVVKWTEAERVSLMNNSIETLGDEVPKCSSLLTLIFSTNVYLTTISDGFFRYMRALRVLDLSKSNIEKFPMSIVELVELQYLNLSGTSLIELPSQIKKLVKLKCLDLSHTKQLRHIPCETLSRLSKLQVLDLTKSNFGEWYARSFGGQDYGTGLASIEELECLKDLKYLSIIIASTDSLERLLCIDKFARCTIRLRILLPFYTSSLLWLTPRLLQSLNERRNGCLPNLREVYVKNCYVLHDLSWLCGASTLEVLSVKRCNCLELISDNTVDRCFPRVRRIVIKQCPTLKELSWFRGALNLESLCVHSCEDLQVLCDSITDNCFPKLQKVEIVNCPALKDLSWLHGAPNLKSLCVKRCGDLETICDGITDGYFPNLGEVDIDDCPALKDLSWLRGASKLESLRVKRCRRLKAIFDGSMDGCFSNLQLLYISDCEGLELIYDDGEEILPTFSQLRSLTLVNLPVLRSIPWFSFVFKMRATVDHCPQAPIIRRSNIKLNLIK